MKKQYKIVSVRMSREDFDRLESMKYHIIDTVKLPVSLHWLLNEAIRCGTEELNKFYRQSTPQTF
jgi:predicted DNA-binding protein